MSDLCSHLPFLLLSTNDSHHLIIFTIIHFHPSLIRYWYRPVLFCHPEISWFILILKLGTTNWGVLPLLRHCDLALLCLQLKMGWDLILHASVAQFAFHAVALLAFLWSFNIVFCTYQSCLQARILAFHSPLITTRTIQYLPRCLSIPSKLFHMVENHDLLGYHWLAKVDTVILNFELRAHQWFATALGTPTWALNTPNYLHSIAQSSNPILE